MNFICIGKIVNTHGIKGELRVLSDFEFKEKVFIPNQVIYIGKKKEKEVIMSYRHHKIFDMITLEGYTNINEVLKYKGLFVYVDKDDLSFEKGEYLDQDLIGLKVFSDGVEHGIVKQIQLMQKGNKLIQVQAGNKTVLIPYQKELIESIDLTKGEIVVVPISGLFYEN